ncbi:hypothetical protein K4B79_45940 [Streptomyces lincolnensis]|uniref:hypothetical protein n=1 Tax=Streptomyces lincolnensis TaxID=1915 RepID=UPI001E335286|nr:hypothetical protein [Streptomyces lincolnensis]MCD7445505.1 hypothetical protein [Streptomyces lincolnensis]
MVSVTPTARDIEITAEGLQADLARLELQKQALERELAAVTAHLGSVQRALGALRPLMPGAAASSATHRFVAADADADAEAPVTVASVPTRPAPVAAPAPVEEGAGSRATADRAESDTDGVRTYGKLTEQILAYFAQAGDVDVRARDVADALGRATDSGSINAIRSTLDRLVGSSRVRRVGRGLYRAAKP